MRDEGIEKSLYKGTKKHFCAIELKMVHIKDIKKDWGIPYWIPGKAHSDLTRLKPWNRKHDGSKIITEIWQRWYTWMSFKWRRITYHRLCWDGFIRAKSEQCLFPKKMHNRGEKSFFRLIFIPCFQLWHCLLLQTPQCDGALPAAAPHLGLENKDI